LKDRAIVNLRDAPRRLATTRWSMIARAASTSEDRRAALGTLCELYWYPLYSFARRAGHGSEDAADLTQEFLARFLERRDVEKTSPERGRFRSYLLQAMRNFLANEWRNGNAQKRRGDTVPIRVDARAAEHRYAAELVEVVDAEQLYLRRFAMTAIGLALSDLEEECRRAGKSSLFIALRPALVGEIEAGDYEALTVLLSMSAGAIKVAAHRLRKRFQEHVRAQILDTVEDGVEVDEEIRALMAAL
jgi:RNA polymerase sigma factor (sigma-70 family)